MQPRQDAGLLQVVDAVGEDAAGDDHQGDAAPGEEAGQVDLQDAAVQEVTESGSHGEAQEGAEQRGAGFPAGLGRGPQEQRRLQAFPPDRQSRHKHHAPGGAVGHAIDAGAQFAAERAGGARHPEDHPGDQSDGDDGQAAADRFLGFEGEAAGTEGQQGAETDGHRDSDSHARPQPGEQRSPATLGQVCHQQDNDERRLEALPEADEEVGCHENTFCRRSPS